jgi:hypothetical protein
MRDMTQVQSPAVMIATATLSADNTPVAIDLAGYDGCTILIMVGVGGITFSGTNKIEFVLRHGDNATVGEHAAVAAADVHGVTWATGGIVRSLVAAHAAASVVEVGYIGSKQFISILADFSGTHGAGTPISVVALRQLPLSAPVTS